jgi:hypothetical protein
MTRGVSETLVTELPARFDRLFPWEGIDKRSSVARDIAADLTDLWQDLGGVEHLSTQERWTAERYVYMRRRMVAYESAVMAQEAAISSGVEPLKLPMDAGTYSNFVNVSLGLLKTLGLKRAARPVKRLHEHLAAVS